MESKNPREVTEQYLIDRTRSARAAASFLVDDARMRLNHLNNPFLTEEEKDRTFDCVQEQLELAQELVDGTAFLDVRIVREDG